MKSKMDDIQERKDDSWGMTQFFDNYVDIGSKNSAKYEQLHHKSVLDTRRKTAHSERISEYTYDLLKVSSRIYYAMEREM